MKLFMDTCVLPRCHLEEAQLYRDQFGKRLGFELLPMFDLPEYEDNLRENLSLFSSGPLIFHEPVWGVEHTLEPGEPGWEESEYHLRKAEQYARLLAPTHMVVHLNNGPVAPAERESRLAAALRNVERIRERFSPVRIAVENTGLKALGTQLLDQAEFTALCRERSFPVVVDVGHANANGWDVPRLIRDLKDLIVIYHLHNNDGARDLHDRLRSGTLPMAEILSVIREETPDAILVVEYTTPDKHGPALQEDLAWVSSFVTRGAAHPAGAASFPPTPEMLRPLLSFAFRNMADGVCVIDSSGRLLTANPAGESILGFSGLPGESTRIWELIPFVSRNDELIQVFIDAVTEKEQTRQAFVPYERRDGRLLYLNVSITCAREGGRELYFIILTDLTRLTRASDALSRYTSDDIANFVLNTPEGEKSGGPVRDVSILISDLRGFTAMSSSLRPQDLITVLNHYFSVMLKIISGFSGTVIEFMGDGLFVVFGAPKDDPDHASHAVCAAIAMENAMHRVNKWNLAHGFPEMEMGIGINSGPAVVGNIGSRERMKYGCMGETVNLAGRAESFTIGGQIYITEYTKAQVPERLTIAGEKPFIPKGLDRHLTLYDVTGIGDPYHIHTGERNITWQGGIRETPVSMRRVFGKNVGETRREIRVTDLSDDTRCALIASDISLDDRQDLLLEVGEGLYAKVIARQGSLYVINFTAKPKNFRAWIKSLRS